MTVKILISERRIKRKVKELGKQITKDYPNGIVVIGILKGCVLFLSDLVREIKTDCVIDFIQVRSYTGTKSGTIKLIRDISYNVSSKDVLIVDTILDTGKTVNFIRNHLLLKGARSVKVCVLLDKEEARQIPVRTDYVGFKIPNKFVIGYGLDFNEKYRNLANIQIFCGPEK
jgi:hypoxanthine phosphoribosyltransferase